MTLGRTSLRGLVLPRGGRRGPGCIEAKARFRDAVDDAKMRSEPEMGLELEDAVDCCCEKGVIS